MKDGKRCVEQRSLEEKKAFHKDRLSHFSQSEKRLINPHFFKVDISDELLNTKLSIIERLVKVIEEFTI